MITIRNLYKSFDGGKSFVVNDLSLEINRGETLVLLGSSGSGKTTTLKMINLLVTPTSGSIEIDNEVNTAIDPVSLKRKFGYVFQGIGLFPHMTVAENITIVLRLLNRDVDYRIQKANELLEFVNLDPEQFSDRLPHELSGGQQQRVGVARALANNPDYLLMDEPFGALDAINRDSLQEDLTTLRDKLNKTIIFVTHDVFEALRLGDRIAVMDKGHLIQIADSKTILTNPANDFVRDIFAKPAAQLEKYREYFL